MARFVHNRDMRVELYCQVSARLARHLCCRAGCACMHVPPGQCWPVLVILEWRAPSRLLSTLPRFNLRPQIKEWSEGGKRALMAAHVRSMLQPVPARQP